MLTKNDLILLLTSIEDQGINIDIQLKEVLSTNGIPRNILKFINDNRQFEVAEFYKMLRKNYNHKKSPLYKNLVKEEFKDPIDAIVTLSALSLQIILYARKLKDSRMFLKHSRIEEITRVLNNYYATYDLLPCLKALRVIKADLKSFESILNA